MSTLFLIEKGCSFRTCFVLIYRFYFMYKPFLFLCAFSSVLWAQPQGERHPLYEPQDPEKVTTTSSGDKNLFLNAKVTASSHFDKDTPELAVDGKIEAKKYWGAENLPVWHQIDMGKTAPLSQIRLFPYWEDGRIYQFKIEGSNDGKKWKTLVDQSNNSITGTQDGFSYTFPAQNVRYVKTTFLNNSKGKASGGHLVEIQGFSQAQEAKLHARALDIDYLYPRVGFPDSSRQLYKGIQWQNAWRGERLLGRIGLWSEDNLEQVQFKGGELKNKEGQSIPLQVSFLRYSLGGQKLYADIIDTDMDQLPLPAGTTRSLWVSADVPAGAKPGLYEGSVVVRAAGIAPQKIPVSLNVIPCTLPSPDKWKFHLDIWQHPEAIARWHHVKSWSKEHLDLMRPIVQHLAKAGQKCITTTIIDEAWGGQTYDAYPALVHWTKKTNGKWAFDYKDFDTYVEFMMSEGIKDQINCYSMISWAMKVRYWDEATSQYKDFILDINSPSFEQFWAGFLTDFRAHLKKKGWLNKTCIALDERGDAMTNACRKALEKYAPELKIQSAVNQATQSASYVYDISPMITHSQSLVSGDLLAKRKAEGKKSTFYVCVSPNKPNTFTASPPAEAEWLGLFAAANQLDGFLRWAATSWGRDPFMSTSFGNWPAGDCFLFYPGGLSTPRWERLREGIEDWEKIRLLRELAASPKAKPAFVKAVKEMDSLLKETFSIPKSQGDAHIEDVKKAQDALQKAVDAL